MDIDLQKISVRQLYEGYKNDTDLGSVVGFGGKLDIRPPYQREFVYKDEQRNAVIETVCKGFPLNIMYWAVRDDGTFEVIDGQQRSISICDYIEGNFSILDSVNGRPRYFHRSGPEYKRQILDYELTVYFCKGEPSEKLEWFRIVNIAGEKLFEQELRNAVYAGPWVTDAKRYFSRPNGGAYQIASDYMKGILNRQAYLETAIKWISDNNIDEYMALNCSKPNANELWLYFQNVIAWVGVTFPVTRKKQMQGVDWGGLHKLFGNEEHDPDALEAEIDRLMRDDDVTNKSGIYSYVLSHDERHLNIRAFTEAQKMTAYSEQDGICKSCGQHFEFEQMDGDHILPWSEGGQTIPENLQMLCVPCNRG